MTGLLASFPNEAALELALDKLRATAIDIETYSPTAPRRESGGSLVPLAMFVSGMLGFVAFFALMADADLRAYPQNIGGRPNFAWPAFVPIAFELGVLCAMIVGFFGFFAACRMPVLYEPVDACRAMRGASRDRWLVAVRTPDASGVARAREALAFAQPDSIEEFEA